MQIQKDWFLPTGNDTVAIPCLKAADATAESVNVLSKRYRGMVEFTGGDKDPFLQPWLVVGGKALDLGRAKDLKVTRESSWVPRFSLSDKKAWELSVTVLAPAGERGFVLEIRLKNLSGRKLDAVLGARGCWSGLRLAINESFPLKLERSAQASAQLAARHLVLTASSAAPEFSLAIGGNDELDFMDLAAGPLAKPGAFKAGKALEAGAKPLRWAAGKKVSLAAGEEARVGILFGFGLETVSAAASCVEMRRQGLERLSERTTRFLAQRHRVTGDAALDEVLNQNLLFNYFYAMGQTLDSEELVCLTSRSPRYYVSGAYWDRDSMLWSFPAVLLLDQRRARQMLEHALLVQGRNIGVHSRFIDGTVLEPGFELDELCAPIIALASYTRHTGDLTLANDWQVRKVLRHAERLLQSKKHPQHFLYETTSGPSDDFEPMGYLTYDNVLVWRMLMDLAEVKDKAGRDQEARAHRDVAEKVRAAVWSQLTADGPRGRMFAWSADLKGAHRFYTEPAGCLQLLPYWGFCDPQDQVWRNTVAWLHSREFQYSFHGAAFEEIGCAHAPHPWVLGLCNSLLSGRRDQARDLLLKLPLDGGLACESFSEKDGKPASGQAFATAAGFLAWALWKAFGKAGA